MNNLSSDTSKTRRGRLAAHQSNARLRLVYRRPAPMRANPQSPAQAGSSRSVEPVLPVIDILRKTVGWLKALFTGFTRC